LSWNSIERAPFQTRSPSLALARRRGLQIPPQLPLGKIPLDSARHARRAWFTAYTEKKTKCRDESARVLITERDQKQNRGPPPEWGGPKNLLVLFFPGFFPATLARQGFLHPFLFARFQVEGMTLHFLNDVFLLHLALKPAQSVFEGLTLLKSDFGHLNLHPQTGPAWTG
jgi:hypothetical protein